MKLGMPNYGSDPDLINRIRNKDEGAARFLLAVISRHLINRYRQKAADYRSRANLIASVTVTILMEMDQEPVLTCQPVTYAISIARKQWNNYQNKFKEEPMPEWFFNTLVSVEDVYEEVEKSERLKLVNRCLSKMNGKCRRLLELLFEESVPDEAYRALGYASKSIYQVRKSECLNRLRELIRNSPEFNELFAEHSETENNEGTE